MQLSGPTAPKRSLVRSTPKYPSCTWSTNNVWVLHARTRSVARLVAPLHSLSLKKFMHSFMHNQLFFQALMPRLCHSCEISAPYCPCFFPCDQFGLLPVANITEKQCAEAACHPSDCCKSGDPSPSSTIMGVSVLQQSFYLMRCRFSFSPLFRTKWLNKGCFLSISGTTRRMNMTTSLYYILEHALKTS